MFGSGSYTAAITMAGHERKKPPIPNNKFWSWYNSASFEPSLHGLSLFKLKLFPLKYSWVESRAQVFSGFVCSIGA